MSTDEKLGADALAPGDEPAAVPPAAAPLDMPDEPLELEPDAAGEDVDLSLLALPDDELCATATLDSANSAAAVATLTNFRFNIGWSP